MRFKAFPCHKIPLAGRNRVPFLMVTMRARTWLALSDPDSDDAANALRKRVDASFNTENDAMNVEVRPTDSGVRIRADFQSGFISLMGRGITSGIENGVFNPPQETSTIAQRTDPTTRRGNLNPI